MVEEIKPTIPELPAARRRRFVDEYILSYEDAKHLCEDQVLADFFESMFSELLSWIETIPELETADEEIVQKEKNRLSKLAVGWLISKYGGLLADKNIAFEDQKISPENFAEFIVLIAKGRLSTRNGLQVLQKMMETGADPEHLIEEHNLNLVVDESELSLVVQKIMAANPDEAERFRNGEQKLIKFFLGQIMKETGGKADPNVAKMVLEQELGE
jgi:aspartyl-tRNA(Asn)/glutamyl-tRNA(Gln) amidotransferase subunit B